MSYPHDGLPRFKTIDPYGVSRGSGRLVALVLDRAQCHKVVARCEHSSLPAAAALAAAKAVRMNLEMDPFYEPAVEDAA